MSVRVGFDIGGTFTDIFIYQTSSGEIIQHKVPTTPDDFSLGVIDGIREACESEEINPGDISYLSHGTTISTNALLEEQGVETGLITTKGFRDIPRIGREKRKETYNYSPEKVPAFVERRRCLGVDERISGGGEVLTPIDRTEVERVTDQLLDSGVEAIAVSLLNAYVNDQHERVVKDVVEEMTNLPVSISSEIMPEIQEYERTLTTLMNAYTAPLTNEYIDDLVAKLGSIDVDVIPYIMQSNGGLMSPNQINARSVRLINSGPAAGVIGAKKVAESMGFDDVITLDMGGTSADSCLIREGEIKTSTKGEINDIPLLFPQIDIRTIGAGGGSIAWVNDAGVLKVGPKSSGADPGPACYGRGGTRPTVTDAALLLGYFSTDHQLGGGITLDESAAREAIESLGESFNRDAVSLAEGIIEIAIVHLKQAIRLVTVEEGYDPRDFVLVCYGGAGPLFATQLAEELGIENVLIPVAPGVLSANGLLLADKEFDFSLTRTLPFSRLDGGTVEGIVDELAGNARSELGVSNEEDVEFDYAVDVRYRGQSFTITIDVPDDGAEAVDDVLRETFERRYEDIYDHSFPDKELEAVTWRLTVVDEIDDIEVVPADADHSIADAKKGFRDVISDGTPVEYAVFDRVKLPPNSSIAGPMIIEESEATTVVGEAGTVQVDDRGNLLVTLR